MSISFKCDECGRRYRVNDRLAGKWVCCKQCGGELQVPEPGDAVDEPSKAVEAPAEQDYSESGSPIYRYSSRRKEFEVAVGDEDTIEAIGTHIRTFIGEPAHVFHEIISDLVHVDVHLVRPGKDRPYHTLITSGMSDRPMTVPEGAEAFQHAELMLSLPKPWPLDQEDFEDERNFWPLRWLKLLARFPHEYNTWLGYGHTLPHGDPPQPFAANTRLCCAMLLYPMLVPDEFLSLSVAEDKTIRFYSLVPLYREEMEFKLKHGAEALQEKLEENQVTELLDVKRKNVCKKK